MCGFHGNLAKKVKFIQMSIGNSLHGGAFFVFSIMNHIEGIKSCD
uniref:Uncharacterized protein n=1 Tax=uncultured Desulfobacterium sp. TaxID=201089 RepID=E1Y8X4_9BACT|nr:unknown protein [uncultured Desulfobacterium sp.]